eukprot:3736648-Prymnesium_polylepis.1
MARISASAPSPVRWLSLARTSRPNGHGSVCSARSCGRPGGRQWTQKCVALRCSRSSIPSTRSRSTRPGCARASPRRAVSSAALRTTRSASARKAIATRRRMSG